MSNAAERKLYSPLQADAPLLTKAELDAKHAPLWNVQEVHKDTFWLLIQEVKNRYGEDMDAAFQWLKSQLVRMGPREARNFHNILHGYSDLAYKYGLWTAAAIMLDGCTDDGFMDFRVWLVVQGREVYIAALDGPDSLADAADYQDQRFVCLPHMGDRAYEELTGQEIYEAFDPVRYDALKAELKTDIVYGDGIGYPYDAADVPTYLPRLCRRYMPEGVNIGAWNVNSLEIRAAHARAEKSKKLKRNQGESR